MLQNKVEDILTWGEETSRNYSVRILFYFLKEAGMLKENAPS